MNRAPVEAERSIRSAVEGRLARMSNDKAQMTKEFQMSKFKLQVSHYLGFIWHLDFGIWIFRR